MPDQQEIRLGQQVGEYRLVRKLGGGGFGTVYLAEHIHEHTPAAVKVLDIPLTKSEDFKDFINEARTMRLRHPHIVPLLDFGISRDDLPFLVMEYAPQGTLRDRHPKGERIPLSTIVSYIDQLAPALQYAHDQRIIHRDIKPENILVRANGTLMVSDFGIAKFLEQSLLISMHKLAGTPAYMAPEQHKGKPCFASDQYALAVIIYEWICGVRPFQGTAFGLAAQHMNTPPPPLRDHLPTLPTAVERVVLKALAKNPEDRFARIQEFADALREAAQPPIILSPPIETMNTARLKPAIQTTDVPPSLYRSAPALPPAPLGLPRNAVSPSSQKHPSGRRFSLLTRRSLGFILLLVVLVIALFGGGTYYFLHSTSQLSNASALINRANTESSRNNPVDALQHLSQAQNALLSTQGPFLVGDQVTQYNSLQQSLRKAFQKAMVAYNHKESITQLPCDITQSTPIRANGQPMSLSTLQDGNGTLYSYVLMTDHNLYQLDVQHRLTVSFQFPNNGSALRLTGNGQRLFVLTSSPAGNAPVYGVNMLSLDQSAALKDDPVSVDGNLVNQGWAPAFLTVYDTDVYVVLTAPKFPHQVLILDYDTNNWHNPPQTLQTFLSPDIVSVAAFPKKQMFLLTTDGHVRTFQYETNNMPQFNDVSLQNPVSPPLANDGVFTGDTPIVTPVPQSSQVETSAQSDSTLLVAGSVGGNPHLYVVDNANHRIMDLAFIPSQPVTLLQTTPVPTSESTTPSASPTPATGAGAVSQPSLKLLQQFASTSILSSMKSVTVGSDGKQLYLLTQGGGTLTTISSIDKELSC